MQVGLRIILPFAIVRGDIYVYVFNVLGLNHWRYYQLAACWPGLPQLRWGSLVGVCLGPSATHLMFTGGVDEYVCHCLLYLVLPS